MIKESTSTYYTFITLGVVGMILRLGLSAVSIGSNDMFIWQHFAGRLEQTSVENLYRIDKDFNHPPLMGKWAHFAFNAAQYTGLRFAFIFKLPSVMAEGFTAYLLYLIWKRRSNDYWGAAAFCLYSWSLVSVFISAYHGNTDAMYVFLMLLAIYLAADCNKYGLAGVALAGALNVKLIPILIVIPLLLFIKTKKQFMYFLGGLSLAVLPFLSLVTSSGAYLYRNIFRYTSQVNYWGINWFLKTGSAWQGQNDFYLLSSDFVSLLNSWSFVPVLLALAAAFYAKVVGKRDLYEVVTIMLSVWLVFTCGFGIQYLIILAPFIMAVSLRLGFVYAAIAGLFAGAVYYSFLTSWYPVRSVFYEDFLPSTRLLSLLTWLIVVLISVRLLFFQAQHKSRL